jgi:PKD repeat protein
MPSTPPVAEFTSNSPVPFGNPVLFDNLTTGSEPIAFEWDFGDGTTSTEFEPAHLYSDIGTYTVTLTATNDSGTHSTSHPVIVEPIDFTSVDLTLVTPGIIYAGDTIDFSAELSPDDATKPYTYTIQYGDGASFMGTSSTDPLSLDHIYSAGGNYTIALDVMNVGMTVPVTGSLELEVIEPVAITGVDLTLDTPEPIYAGDPLQFSADLLPDDATKPYTYTILYGDGISITNTSSDDPLVFSHVYSTGGNFTVQIAVLNDTMTDPVTDSLSLEVLVPDPMAVFSSNSPVLLGQPVQFTNLSIGLQPITYEWDFGDGAGTSTETNPSYTYAAIGTYTVTLEATNALGSDSVSHQITVEPLAITTVDLTQITSGSIFVGDPVEFSAELLPDSFTKPYTYTIDYGDGTLLTLTSSDDPLSLSHDYASGGSYTVSIEVWNVGMVGSVSDVLDVTVSYRSFLPITAK